MNVQETIAGVSQNSNECDNPDRMKKELKESIGQSGCFVPHGKRLHSSAFLPQPDKSLISLSQIQENILSHSDIERRRLQYDNAWDILEKGDSRLSNNYGPSITTKQLNTSYVFVGSVQETSREVKPPSTPSSGLTDDTCYSGDTKDYKSMSKKLCSMKKICKYILWILIFLGISAVVAILLVNNQNRQPTQSTNSMEAQIDGNTEVNRTLNSALENFDDSIKKTIESMKTFLEKYIKSDGSELYSGVPCRKNTTSGCVQECHLMCNGDYQSCETCKGYVTCSFGHITALRPCQNSHVVWDDNLKRCEAVSSTCEQKDT